MESDEARCPEQVYIDAVGFYLTFVWTISSLSLNVLRRYVLLYWMIFRVTREKQVAAADEDHMETTLDGRGGALQSFLLFLGKRGAPGWLQPVFLALAWLLNKCMLSRSNVEERQGAEHERDKVHWHQRRSKSLAFFRLKATSGLQGYTNEEMSHGNFPDANGEKIAATVFKTEVADDGEASNKYVIFDVGTGEAKTLLCSFLPKGAVLEDGTKLTKPTVRVEDLENGSFKDQRDQSIPVQGLCDQGDTTAFVDWVGAKLRPRVTVPVDVAERTIDGFCRRASQDDSAAKRRSSSRRRRRGGGRGSFAETGSRRRPRRGSSAETPRPRTRKGPRRRLSKDVERPPGRSDRVRVHRERARERVDAAKVDRRGSAPPRGVRDIVQFLQIVDLGGAVEQPVELRGQREAV